MTPFAIRFVSKLLKEGIVETVVRAWKRRDDSYLTLVATYTWRKPATEER